MIERILKVGFVAAGLAVAVAAGAVAQESSEAQAWEHPVTPWGDPDLRGMWPVGHLTGTPLERPAEYGEREYLTDEEFAERRERFEALQARYEEEIKKDKMGMGHWAESGNAQRRTSLIVDPADGQLPEFTEDGERRSAQMRSSWQDIAFETADDFDSWDRCITRGMPASMFPFQYNNGIQVMQAPGYVVLRLEMIHETRIIPVDGRPQLSPKIRHWMGESRGHWEGNTLVVETTNFKPGPSATNIGTTGSPRGNNTPISEEATIVETFTRTGDNTIEYTVTHNDPVVFTEPWTAKLAWQRDPDYEFFEYACHEDNYTIRDYINASRAGRAQDAPQ